MTVKQYLKCYALSVLLAPLFYKFFNWFGTYYVFLYFVAMVFGFVFVFHLFDEGYLDDLDCKISEAIK